MLGLSAAVLGTWVERSGPRKSMLAAAICWASGFAVGALGVATDQLWLLYLGYGVIGGIGLGIGYISPVSTLIKWFPDRPGLATGLAIMGFGGGALHRLAVVVQDSLDDVRRWRLGRHRRQLPHPGRRSTSWHDPRRVHRPGPRRRLGARRLHAGHRVANGMRTAGDVTAANAIRTRSFWLLWVVLFCNVTAGIGILEQASPMIQDYFVRRRRHRRPPATSACSRWPTWRAASCGPHLGLIGRKPIYMVYLGVGTLLYIGVATVGTSSLVLFVLMTAVILSFYGGGFATVPAYLKDLFGGLQVGAIHGRLLIAWSAAGVAGPLIVNGVADAREAAGAEGADLYGLSLSIMVGFLVVGFVANLAISAVPERYHEGHDERGGDRLGDRAARIGADRGDTERSKAATDTTTADEERAAR